MEMTCPKCQGVMRSYERNGVTVDQCADCRGIFLDRGELERLVDAEGAWQSSQSAAPAPSSPQPGYQQPAYQQPRYDQPRYDQPYGGKGHYPHKRRKSFFDELFD